MILWHLLKHFFEFDKQWINTVVIELTPNKDSLETQYGWTSPIPNPKTLSRLNPQIDYCHSWCFYFLTMYLPKPICWKGDWWVKSSVGFPQSLSTASLVRFVFKTNALSELELLSIFQIVFQLPLFLLEEQFSPLFVWKIILALVKFLLLDIQGIYIHIFTITYLGLSPFCDHTIRPYLSHWTGHRALDNRERWHMSPRVNISAVLLSNSCLKFHI